MARKWTREERRSHLREKYFPWKKKIFVVVVAVAVLFISLYLTLVGFSATLPLQLVSALLIAVSFLVLFLVVWGGYSGRSPLPVLIALLIVVIVLLSIWAAGLPALGQLIASIIMGFLLLVLIAVLVFFVDMITYELE
ncbi:MAG: hypothetical protein HY369_04725 [Candidatus Aenigmarchaeota archaeon]|nr:hypothetical protein [Candidatus Aenigmarchaeota archaeon]